MNSMTALNLERNAIQSLDGRVFDGVTDTLSSVSLLNNMLTEFPLLALRTLPKLRVRFLIAAFGNPGGLSHC